MLIAARECRQNDTRVKRASSWHLNTNNQQGDIMKKTLLAALLAFALPAAADEDERWLALDQTENAAVSVLKGSYERKANINSVIVKFAFKRDNSIEVFRWAVSDESCKSGFGVIKGLDMSGKVVMSNDFAFGAGSIASLAAEFICNVSNEMKKAKL
jgi:hypothetical protein